MPSSFATLISCVPFTVGGRGQRLLSQSHTGLVMKLLCYRAMIVQEFCKLSLGALFVVLLSSCAGTPKSDVPRMQVPPPSEPVTLELDIYRKAINDALNPEPSEVVDNLTPIKQSNTAIVWRNFDDGPRVLMVSLVGDTSFYTDEVGKSYNPGDYYIWVTAVPELRELCREPGFGGNDISLRLRQLLGLTPTTKVVAFVEFWVAPTQLFRPTADNEITDTTAGLNLPDDTEPWYREWFNTLRAHQYFQSEKPKHNAYPWTQLGYTYDWGKPNSPQGLSEFVIKANEEVIINAIFTIDAYCDKSS